MSVNEFTTGELVEFKGSKKGIIVNIKRKATFDEIKNSIIDKLESSIGFFNGAKICSINCEYLSDIQIMMLKDDIASGNVIVMGSVSGFIHAGAHGNKNAYVVAGNLNPKVLQIAGNIAEAPDDENYEENKQNIPEIAFVSNDIIVIESYLPKTIK